VTATRWQRGLELTADRLFTHRIRRLIGVSVVALGVIWALAFMDGAPVWALALLGTGWVLMPSILAVSLRRPMARYGLVVPATVVPLGLTGMIMVGQGSTANGWIVMTIGIVFGGFLGMWFWFRWLPVPRILDDPFGLARVSLVGIHIALVLAGAAMVVTGL
jgi:hypothetical protein